MHSAGKTRRIPRRPLRPSSADIGGQPLEAHGSGQHALFSGRTRPVLAALSSLHAPRPCTRCPSTRGGAPDRAHAQRRRRIRRAVHQDLTGPTWAGIHTVGRGGGKKPVLHSTSRPIQLDRTRHGAGEGSPSPTWTATPSTFGPCAGASRTVEMCAIARPSLRGDCVRIRLTIDHGLTEANLGEHRRRGAKEATLAGAGRSNRLSRTRKDIR